ncbi:MAG: YqiJ family protein [Proteobacteria bacterium]|nr:YqiJ family protein [Pseudomonadota bacterium]MDA0967345.1 YqiJ family protein [Pseudomonadota bacterium]
MLDFLGASENLPFTVALAVFVVIAIMEGIGTLFGAGISNVLESLFPDTDIAFDIEGPDMDSPTALSRILSWLRIGQVPVLVLMVIFLVSFGLYGLVMQNFLLVSFGFMVPAVIAWIPPLALALPTMRWCGGGLAKIIPKDETSAVSHDSFIGRVATITLGKASSGSPAQGKLKDTHGKTHYVMLEPDLDGESFEQGTEVLLVKRAGGVFYAIANTNSSLAA